MSEEDKRLIHVVDRRDTDAALAAAYGNKYISQTHPELSDDIYFTSSGLHVQKLNEARETLRKRQRPVRGEIPHKIDPNKLEKIAELVIDYAVIADLRKHKTGIKIENPDASKLREFLKYLGGDEERKRVHKTMRSEGLTPYEEKVNGASKVDHPQQTTARICAPFDKSERRQRLELVLVMNPKDVKTVKDIGIPGLPPKNVKGLESYAGITERAVFDTICTDNELYSGILKGIKEAVEKSVEKYLSS